MQDHPGDRQRRTGAPGLIRPPLSDIFLEVNLVAGQPLLAERLALFARRAVRLRLRASERPLPGCNAYLFAARGLPPAAELEALATEAALTRGRRPNLKITLPALSAEAMGQLILLAEAATVFAGGLWQINPLDQPGVEAGKKYAYGLMGRKGFEAKAKEIKEQFRRNDRYRI